MHKTATTTQDYLAPNVKCFSALLSYTEIESNVSPYKLDHEITNETRVPPKLIIKTWQQTLLN